MIGEMFRAMRRLREVRQELRVVSAEHSATAKTLISTADDISKRRISAAEDRRLDDLVRRWRQQGAI